MHTRLSQFVEAHKILFKTQLGFLKQYSVDIAPLVLREKIQNCAENGDFFVAIYLDFSWYGTRGIELDWFKNYRRSHATRYVWWLDWIGLNLFNDDTRPSGHISRPTQVNVSELLLLSKQLLKSDHIVHFGG